MRRTPGWVRAISAIITVAGLMAADMSHGRAVSPATAVLDPFLTPAYAVAEIRGTGRAAFCSIEANRWRPGRPDSARLLAAAAPAAVKPVREHRLVTTVDDGWRPLDPDRWRLAADVLVDRLAVCAAKGFTGAVISVGDEPGSGPTRVPDQLVQTLVREANQRGLVVVLVRHAPDEP